MFHAFELSHNGAEENAKSFVVRCKNFDYQASSDRPKSVDYKVMIRDM